MPTTGAPACAESSSQGAKNASSHGTCWRRASRRGSEITRDHDEIAGRNDDAVDLPVQVGERCDAHRLLLSLRQSPATAAPSGRNSSSCTSGERAHDVALDLQLVLANARRRAEQLRQVQDRDVSSRPAFFSAFCCQASSER